MIAMLSRTNIIKKEWGYIKHLMPVHTHIHMYREGLQNIITFLTCETRIYVNYRIFKVDMAALKVILSWTTLSLQMRSVRSGLVSYPKL